MIVPEMVSKLTSKFEGPGTLGALFAFSLLMHSVFVLIEIVGPESCVFAQLTLERVFALRCSVCVTLRSALQSVYCILVSLHIGPVISRIGTPITKVHFFPFGLCFLPTLTLVGDSP